MKHCYSSLHMFWMKNLGKVTIAKYEVTGKYLVTWYLHLGAAQNKGFLHVFFFFFYCGTSSSSFFLFLFYNVIACWCLKNMTKTPTQSTLLLSQSLKWNKLVYQACVYLLHQLILSSAVWFKIIFKYSRQIWMSSFLMLL